VAYDGLERAKLLTGCASAAAIQSRGYDACRDNPSMGARLAVARAWHHQRPTPKGSWGGVCGRANQEALTA